MRRIRSHLTYANVMVTILAFIVLTGGTAVALSGSNTVQSDDLGPGAQVKAADLADLAVRAEHIQTAQIEPRHFGNIFAARAKKTINQSVANDTYAPLAFDAEDFDTAALHDNTANKTRLTAPKGGIYQVSAGVDWAVSAAGFRELGLTVNGGTCCLARSVIDPVTQSGGGTHQTVSDLVRLSIGHFVEAQVKQTSGGPLAARALVPGGTFLAMHWVGPVGAQ